MTHVLKNERGMALAIAIVALVVVGALVAGALFSGTQEQRVAENVRRTQASFGVAEQGIYDIIRNWSDPNNKATYAGLYPYPAVAPSSSWVAIQKKTAASKTGSYNGTIMKLNDGLYLIDMTGQDTMSLAGRIRGGGASQRMGLIARIRPLAVNIQAAVTSGGTNLVAGNVTIAGNDSAPDGWAGCPPKDSAKAGVRMQVGDSITRSGNARITGGPGGNPPPVIHDPSLKDSAFSVYGDVTFAQLAAMATISLPGQNFANGIGPAVTNGLCDYTVQTNWGSPTNPAGPCGNFFPIIYINGDAQINGQEGQGILLVNGGLSVQGGFQFYGITIVRGSIKTAGGGGTPAHFWGALMAQDTVQFSDTVNNFTGGATMLYSKCAILKALDKTGTGSMLRSRGWAQLF
jgi:hypothetical protein